VGENIITNRKLEKCASKFHWITLQFKT